MTLPWSPKPDAWRPGEAEWFPRRDAWIPGGFAWCPEQADRCSASVAGHGGVEAFQPLQGGDAPNPSLAISVSPHLWTSAPSEISSHLPLHPSLPPLLFRRLTGYPTAISSGADRIDCSLEIMNAVRVSITAFVNDDFPGWVACELADSDGVLHQFIEKVPVVSNEDLRQNSDFPRDGAIACNVISNWQDDLGRSLSKIDTSQPWGIESKAGITDFVVHSRSLQSTN